MSKEVHKSLNYNRGSYEKYNFDFIFVVSIRQC